MAKTLTQLHTALSFRYAESSVPTGTEYNRRTQFFNEAIFAITRKHYWWWTEGSDAFNSIANQTSYSSADGFPSDIRNSLILELRYNGQLYTPTSQTTAFNLPNTTYSGLAQEYFIFNKSLYPVPPFPASGTDTITLKYYKIPTVLSSGSDTILLPDEYADILIAFALGRVLARDGKRGSAADAYDEYNEIYKDMVSEQTKYEYALKSNENHLVADYE